MQSLSWYNKDQCTQQSKKLVFYSIQTKVYQLTSFFLKLVLNGSKNDHPPLAQKMLKPHCQENSEIQESLRLLIYTLLQQKSGQMGNTLAEQQVNNDCKSKMTNTRTTVLTTIPSSKDL